MAEETNARDRLGLFFRSRETVLSLCAVILIVLFFLTGSVVRSYHRELDALGSQWFAAGQEQLKTNNAPAALSDFHNALVYRPDDAQVQFQLAQALSVEGRNEEARSYLLGIVAHSPSDARVNLALARIAARSDSESDALRYYHGAIYGVWPKNAEINRLNARLELSRFLLARGDPSAADGELVALGSEIPLQNGAPLDEQAGELFLRANDLTRAREEFRRALAVPHPPTGALRGLGLTSYQMGDFHLAERYLERAYRERRDDSEVDAALDTTRLVLAWDPDMRGLTEAERRERVRHDLADAISRVESCAETSGIDLTKTGTGPATDLATEYSRAKSLQTGLSDRNLARHPEQLETAINLMFTLESAATQKCGQPTGLDKALVVLGTYRQGEER